MLTSFIIVVSLFLALWSTVRADFPAIATYLPQTDVSQHLAVDLDQNSINTQVGNGNFTGARYWYTVGGNSYKTTSPPVLRTIQGFSTSYTSLVGEKWYDIYSAYWNDPSYADSFVMAAATATRELTPSINPLIGDTSRQECFKKGSAYQNIWYYIIHEMEAAIEDCTSGVVGQHWDEAVAFYTGSMVGSTGASTGVMIFDLAEKRCKNFGTCIADDDSPYDATVNYKIFDLFEQGRDLQYSTGGTCQAFVDTKEDIVVQMVVPLIQGVMRYLFFAPTDGTEKSRSELYAFAAAVLPYVDYYDSAVAEVLRRNTNITNLVPVPDGYTTVKASLESAYPAMGITCGDVGGLVSTAYTSGYYPGMEPCTDVTTSSSNGDGSDSDEGLPAYGIALIVIFIVLFVALGAWFAVAYWKGKNGPQRLEDNDPIVNV
jgi:hypothetical protein